MTCRQRKVLVKPRWTVVPVWEHAEQGMEIDSVELAIGIWW